MKLLNKYAVKLPNKGDRYGLNEQGERKTKNKTKYSQKKIKNVKEIVKFYHTLNLKKKKLKTNNNSKRTRIIYYLHLFFSLPCSHSLPLPPRHLKIKINTNFFNILCGFDFFLKLFFLSTKNIKNSMQLSSSYK